MPVRIALVVVLAACWDAWRLLAGRVEDAAGSTMLLVLLGALGWRLWRMKPATRISAPMLVGLLGAYALATWTGPALLQIGAAVFAVTILLSGDARSVHRWPIIGATLLALPILPTLDFLLAYPLRRISVLITAALLRMNGMGVSVEGVALEWHGQRLLFDGPCSGVKMLWAALMLASLIAFAQGAGLVRYAGLLAIAVAAAVVGNALRAASLFYLENDFIAPLQGPVAHEAVGIAAFAMLALAILAASPRSFRRTI
jgi:exosortase/archaeosortase family protein